MKAPPSEMALQAVRRHEYADPLAAPGEADLTAMSISRRSRRQPGAEAGPRSLLTQAGFLFDSA
jgi:SAM-dependent MidA family methyltransferase